MSDFAELKDEQLQKLLNSVAQKVNKINKGAQEYIKFVAPIAQRDVAAHFADEQGPEGKWDDWSDSYLKLLRKTGSVGQILARTGRLRQSVIPASGVRGRPGFIPILVNKAQTKGGFPYALHHDEGKSSSKGNPRSFMWLSDSALENMAKSSLQFLLKDFGE